MLTGAGLRDSQGDGDPRPSCSPLRALRVGPIVCSSPPRLLREPQLFCSALFPPQSALSILPGLFMNSQEVWLCVVRREGVCVCVEV